MTTETPPIPESILTYSQKKTYGPHKCPAYGPKAQIIAKVRYDDSCKNGHNTFAITADIYDPTKKGDARDIAGGCCHEEIAAAFPQLAPLIKWHLVSSDGPMHYVANVVYLAGNRDCWGKLKGEPRSFDRVLRWNGFPISWRGRSHTGPAFLKWCEENGAEYIATEEVIAIDHVNTPGDTYKFGPKYTIGNYPAHLWHECPFDTEAEALEFLSACRSHGFTIESEATSWGEGKERELDSARHAAVWPEATDEELSQEPEKLKAALLWRLPQLLQDFRAAVESLGFTY